jgi:hypothetical protein
LQFVLRKVTKKSEKKRSRDELQKKCRLERGRKKKERDENISMG